MEHLYWTTILLICKNLTGFIRAASELLSCTQAALRVPLAVTWLTVYRQLHIWLLLGEDYARRWLGLPGRPEHVYYPGPVFLDGLVQIVAPPSAHLDIIDI